MPATPLPPQRIGQIEITVADVERATAFYRDVLGLEHLFSAPPGLSFFRCGEVRLMLARPEGSDRRAPASILYYAVTDVGAAHRLIEERGGEVVEAPHVVHRTDAMELWIGFYRDTEGNTLGLMSEVARPSGGS